jgi:hypothetical protein
MQIPEPMMPNYRLLPATIAAGGRYALSGLRIVDLAKEITGDIADAGLLADNHADVSYPLVSGKDLWGQNIIIPLWIRAMVEGSMWEMYFPEAVVNISRSREIVATPVLNGRGTVKEMITEGDLDVSISLAVVSTADDGSFDGQAGAFVDRYPYDGVSRLRKLLDAPVRLDVMSDFLTLFDLDGGELGLVVKSYSANQETHTNRQVFEIQALSDYDYNLLIPN